MRSKGTWCLKQLLLEVFASLQCLNPMLSSFGQSCDDLMEHMQHCLEKALSLLPVEQPGCLAILLPPLTFLLVLQPSLFPVHAGAEPNFHLLPAQATFPRVLEHWMWEQGLGMPPLSMDPAQPCSLLSIPLCRRSQLLCLMWSTTWTALGTETQQRPFRGGCPVRGAVPRSSPKKKIPEMLLSFWHS